MKLARLENSPSALIDFFEEGLTTLGAVCERSWHDRLQLVAEGSAARLWDAQGGLLEKEIHFIPPDDASPRTAESEVFPGCPLTFRLAEELRPVPLPLERGILQNGEAQRPPTFEAAERLWHAQLPGTSRWGLEGILVAGWHFSLLALARCEIQAIDQRWTLHRVGMSLANGNPDHSLTTGLDFVQLASASPQIPWPCPDLKRWQGWLTAAFGRELESDLDDVRQRQQRFLHRELQRVEEYFQGYEKELGQRERRSQAEGTKLKAQERLLAARAEHARRRQDQIRRHEIRIIIHLDALLLLAEPAWQGRVSFMQKGEHKTTPALFVSRSRQWIVPS